MTHLERLRRNVALHWNGLDALVSHMTPSQLRKAQKRLLGSGHESVLERLAVLEAHVMTQDLKEPEWHSETTRQVTVTRASDDVSTCDSFPDHPGSMNTAGIVELLPEAFSGIQCADAATQTISSCTGEPLLPKLVFMVDGEVIKFSERVVTCRIYQNKANEGTTTTRDIM